MSDSEDKPRAPKAEELVNAILSECRDPARLLELYYWSTEPELLPIIRSLASLPIETRQQLGAFFSATDPEHVNATTGAHGGICLVPSDGRNPAASVSKQHH